MSQPTSGQTLDQAIDDLVNAVMNGSLSMIPLNINNTEVISSLSMVSQCMDIGCNSTANMTELVTLTTPTASVTTSMTDPPTEPPNSGHRWNRDFTSTLPGSLYCICCHFIDE